GVALRACVALQALRTLRALSALSALRSLWTLCALGPLGTLRALRPLWSLRPLRADSVPIESRPAGAERRAQRALADDHDLALTCTRGLRARVQPARRRIARLRTGASDHEDRDHGGRRNGRRERASKESLSFLHNSPLLSSSARAPRANISSVLTASLPFMTAAVECRLRRLSCLAADRNA